MNNYIPSFELFESSITESLSFKDIKDKYESNPYGIGASSIEYVKGERGNGDRLIFRNNSSFSRDQVEKTLKSYGFPAKKMSKATADKAYTYRYELYLFESETSDEINEALKDVTLNDNEANVIYDEIKRLTNLHKEKGFVSSECMVSGFDRAAGAFGLNPDDKNFKINSIDATSFDIFACITTKSNIVVCYVTMSYMTEKKSLKPGNYALTFYNGKESNFNQVARRYKQSIYPNS